MPRLPEFDRDSVLDAALDVFMTHGYEASSVNKLLDAMALNRGSLYGSFGDKESLFKEVMETYVALGQPLTESLMAPENPLQGISDFYRRAFLDRAPSEISKGCLLYNTISELSHNNHELAEIAAKHAKALKELFALRLEEAASKKLIAADSDIEALSTTLFTVTMGLRLLCKMGYEKKQLEQVIDVSLACLKPRTS